MFHAPAHKQPSNLPQYGDLAPHPYSELTQRIIRLRVEIAKLQQELDEARALLNK